jgi:mono/diheme cytochrome c family protein
MRIRIFVAASTFAVLFSGCAGVQLPRQSLTDPGQLLFNGYTKPEVNCYHCHNGDGKGARGPNLTKRVPGMTDEGIKNTILDGKGFMPSFKGKISDEEIGQITTWLRAAFPKEAPAAAPAPASN